MSNNHPDYQWEKLPNRDTWRLEVFPYTLIIEHRPGETLPYVGSLRGAQFVLKDHRAWETTEKAAAGIVDWALEELSKSYHKLLQLKGG